MKLKNIMKDVRQFTSFGQIIYVQPKETIEVEQATYDEGVFELIETQKRKESDEQPNNKKEVKKNDTSN